MRLSARSRGADLPSTSGRLVSSRSFWLLKRDRLALPGQRGGRGRGRRGRRGGGRGGTVLRLRGPARSHRLIGDARPRQVAEGLGQWVMSGRESVQCGGETGRPSMSARGRKWQFLRK